MRKWTLGEVKAVIPLVRSILVTVRRHRIGDLCGGFTSAETTKALAELRRLGVVCEDPVRSIASFPARGEPPRRFVYSPFGNELYWQYEGDAVCRPVDDLESPI